MIIDAHNHPDYHGFDAGKIIDNMDEQAIDQLWLLSWDTSQSEYDVRLYQVASHAPDRFVLGYAAPHPKLAGRR